MLPPFIIDQIRKREEEEVHPEQPRIELPIPMRRKKDATPPNDEEQRGVVVIDLF